MNNIYTYLGLTIVIKFVTAARLTILLFTTHTNLTVRFKE